MPSPGGTLPPERLWLRLAAFGVDLLLLSGAPLLLATILDFATLLVVAEPPAWLAIAFHAAQLIAVGLFLCRDAGGASPGKKIVGLYLVGGDGIPSGLLASLVRNAALLLPIWNVVELWAVLQGSVRRPGDRVAGTFLVES
ncbi:MAG: RDD family protein [Thermoanaerobaculia bacterium]